jgi:hypothetical protein
MPIFDLTVQGATIRALAAARHYTYRISNYLLVIADCTVPAASNTGLIAVRTAYRGIDALPFCSTPTSVDPSEPAIMTGLDMLWVRTESRKKPTVN